MRAIIVVCILFISFNGFSQFESSKKGIRFAPTKKKEAPPKQLTEKTSPAVIKYESSIGEKKDDNLGYSILPKKEVKGIMEEEVSTVRKSSELYTETTKKISNELSTKYVSVNYGNFISETKVIKILCRDYDFVDNDQVRVLINDVPVVKNCSLGSSYSLYYVELTQVTNIVDFMALNTGYSAPNTAEFKILDENDVIIYNNQWSLEEGFKARINIECLKNK